MPSTATSILDGLSASVAVKAPVKAASTVNLTLSGEQTIDGVSCIEGDRVLVKDQSTASENGIYVVSTGSWTRSKDFDGNRDVVQGTLVVIGTNGDSRLYYRVASSNPIIIGTSAINFELVGDSLTQAIIGNLLYPRTAAEIAASVTPTNLYIRPGYVDRYGATLDGTTDDSAALLAADAQGGAILPEGATIYLGNSDIEIENPIIGENPNRPSIIKGRFSGTGSTFRARNVKFIADASWTTTNDNYAIKYSEDDGALELDNCTFDGLGVLVSGGGVLERISVTHCTFTGVAQNDTVQALALAAARSILIDGNLFNGQFYRDIKCTNAPGSAGAVEPEYANDLVTITNNHFVGSRFASSEIKQSVDCYAAARKLIVSHNTFALTTNVEFWIDLKNQGSEDTAITSQHEEIIITDNICVGGCDVGAIRVLGAYGQDHEGNRQKAIIARNVIKVTTTAADGPYVFARRFHDVEIVDNIVELSSKAERCISAQGVRRCSIDNNSIDGVITLTADTGNGAGTCPSTLIQVTNNRVSADTTTFYAIQASGLEPAAGGASLIYANNSVELTPATFQAFRVNALGSGWSHTVVEGNVSINNSLPIVFSSTQATRTTCRGNSWQTVPATRNGAGSINVFNQQNGVCHITTGGSAAAVTLVDGMEGQDLVLLMITDGGGDATVTPANLANGSTITFDDAGDSAYLKFTNGAWVFLGGTATLA